VATAVQGSWMSSCIDLAIELNRGLQWKSVVSEELLDKCRVRFGKEGGFRKGGNGSGRAVIRLFYLSHHVNKESAFRNSRY
jgi:hypothetical protein